MNVLFLDCVWALYKLYHRSLSLSCSLFSLSLHLQLMGFRRKIVLPWKEPELGYELSASCYPSFLWRNRSFFCPGFFVMNFVFIKKYHGEFFLLKTFTCLHYIFPSFFTQCMEFSCGSKAHPIYMSSIKKKKLYLISPHRKPYWKKASKFHRKWTTSLSSFALLSFIICCIMVLVIWIQPC